MIDVLLTGLVLLVCLLVGAVIHMARESDVPRWVSGALATTCGVGLIAMLVTDWPTNLLSDFWAQHSVLAAVLSTVLLVGVGFLVWELEDNKKQEKLARGLSGAGFGGIVDHVVDVEVALSLVSFPHAPDRPAWSSWAVDGKPLRWLHEGREVLHRRGVELGPVDPRRQPPTLPEGPGHGWRLTLIDQSIRRLLAGMRDWASLIGQSRDGTGVLLVLSEIRKNLMTLSFLTERGEAQKAEEMLAVLRQRSRLLARFLEDFSGARKARPEVLLGRVDLLPANEPPFPSQLGDELDSEAWHEITTSRSWQDVVRHWGATDQREAEERLVTVDEVREMAREAHRGQRDKLGRDYFIGHVDPVATRLSEHGEKAVMAGLLHDVLEDTRLSSADLVQLGIPDEVVRAVESVTKRAGEPYDALIARSAADPLGRLVKLADNAHNLASNAELAKVDSEAAARLREKYQAARKTLLAGEEPQGTGALDSSKS